MGTMLTKIAGGFGMLPFGKPKTSATTIDNSGAPLDPRLAAGQIFYSIKEVMAADPTKTVIAFIGMQQNILFHQAVHKLTMRAAVTEGFKPLVTIEQSHNLLERFLPLLPGAPDPATAAKALAELKKTQPEKYHVMQSMTAASIEYPGSPVTTHLAASDLSTQSIFPVRMVDLSVWGGGSLDFVDPWTKKIIEQNGYDVSKSIHMASPEGMKLRNIAMLEKIIEEAKETNSKLVIAQTSLGRIAGMGKKFAYEDSLHAMTRDKKLSFTPVTVFLETAKHTTEELPKEAQKPFMRDGNAVIVKGGDSSHFIRNDRRTMFGDLIEEHDYRPEIDKLNSIFNASGFEKAGKVDSYFKPTTSAERNRTILVAALEKLVLPLQRLN